MYNNFLSRVSRQPRGIDASNLSVCMSVCQSIRDVPVLDESSFTYCRSFFTIR